MGWGTAEIADEVRAVQAQLAETNVRLEEVVRLLRLLVEGTRGEAPFTYAERSVPEWRRE